MINLDAPPEALLEIRVTLSTGAVAKFAVEKPEDLAEIFRTLNPTRVFAAQQLIIGGGGSLSVFHCSRIERIDLVGENLPQWQYVGGAVDVRELSEAEFKEAYDPFAAPGSRRKVGEILLGYSTYRTVSGSRLFWEVHMKAVAMLPVDFKQHIQSLLNTPVLHARTAEGHVLLNTACLVSTTFYPGPPESPAGSWRARRIS